MAATDLTTLNSVRLFLQTELVDDTNDPVLGEMITAASEMINRDIATFLPAETAVEKTFVWRGGPLLLHPYFLRSVDSIELDTDETSTTTLATADYRLRPKPPKNDVYRSVRIPGHTVTYGYEREVTVTGDWGFTNQEAVPADVVHWTNVTVATWLRRDAAAFSTTLRLEEDRLERPDALPTAVMRALSRYAEPVGF